MIRGTVKSGTGRINAKISIMYQKFLPLKVYLDNAKPVVADTMVCATANSPENNIEPISDVGISSALIAPAKLLSVKCFASQVIEGSIKSAVVIIDFDIISKIGFKYTYPIQISTKYIAILEMMFTAFNFLNLAKL